MKNAVIVVALAGIFGGIGYWFYQRTARSGEAPAIGQVLPAESTVAVGGLQDLDGVARQILDALAKAPPELTKDMPPFGDPAKRIETIGFDPATREGWASIGVDSAAGVALLVDARIVGRREPVPVALIKIDDRDKLLALIEKKSGQKPAIEAAGKAEAVNFGGEQVLIGKRGEWTAILLAGKRDAKRAAAGFDAFLSDTGAALASRDGWKDAFADGDGSITSFGWFGVASIGPLLAALEAPAEAVGAVPFYAERFPSMGVVLGAESFTARIVATEKGIAVLQQVLRPKKGPPAFGRYLPPSGWAALRVSVNIADMFEGIGELLPPTVPAETKAQLGMAKAMVGAVLGFTWAELSAALSGHVMVGFNVNSAMAAQEDPAKAEWLAVVAANDETASDKLVETLIGKAKAMQGAAGGGPAIEEATVGGLKGWKMAAGPLTIAAVRHDDVWLLGPEAVVAGAVKTAAGDNLKGKADVLEDDDVVYGVHADLKPLLALAEAIPDMKEALLNPALADFAKNPVVAGAWRLDGHGLLARTEGKVSGVAFIVGAMAAVAVPSFIKYQRRAKTSEASMNVRKMFDSSVSYYNEERATREGIILPPQFPATVALTPTQDLCATGGGKYIPTADTWNNPTWQALNFAMDDPHYYRYAYVSSGTGPGAMFTARAIGDLDCDGVLSTFERIGVVDAEGNVNGGSGVYRENELE